MKRYIPSTMTLHLNPHRLSSYFVNTRSKSVDSSSSASQNSGAIPLGSDITPVQMSYASFEYTTPNKDSKNPPVIIMHGLLGSKGNWNSISKNIHAMTNRKIVTADARNHGDSPHTPEFSYNHMAVDLRILMEELGIKKATLIGHSMGGRTVMFFAHTYPEMVDKLIVVEISPISVSPAFTRVSQLLGQMAGIDLEPNVPLFGARKLVNDVLSKHVPDEGVRNYLLTNLVEREFGKYKWRFNLNAISRHFQNLISFPTFGGSFNKPTLFIGGANSENIKTSEHIDIRKIFPKAKFVSIENAGHFPHFEQPKEFIETVSIFIQRNQTRKLPFG
uniref:sn-1-specific diacylglycerol lipase ABHD11 n=1 Tax=Timema bartmani TaxID=61472 RepID=A0A7R9EN48_9NEOP|nr:unnamed protein product [Timema bartmani]